MKKQPKPCSFLFHIALLISALFVFLLISFAFTTSYKHKSGINSLGHKRILASNFDFTPFLKSKDRTQWQRQSQSLTGKETVSWYNDEERLVPSGPNPLHH
ncbi:unnamed protein product [Arabidopsis lyrata]|uniref:Uncharacterized protein n=1 Tax=Arabidopsis lyrata subsp. lyrata TaxID=81972 RepID=D7KDZ4_ARALL|nr:CLAVATA3/ESR (CLE)-related protein 11 [Arabidopsis lyrata subsp. lyrata]EFH70412.1 hypothetical protein ARALYDRAFT_474045 [Arabidopsis lyrata subsp. lyrata]CAH8254987.1 unnamed protein product [Arabidopsis lyrata]|eukprot:XP_020870638.1 CLAVATA3/ESR (CLE)-related protein 11 [Arabidopsis lyrata subsp. lyrata]